MKEEYVATQSALYEFSFLLCLLLLVLGIIPGVIYILVKNLSAHHHVITFYKDKYVIKTGIFNTTENESVLKGVLSASLNQSFKGKIFNYGDVTVDIAGKHNIILTGVKNPKPLRDYLKTRQIEADSLQHVITN